MLFLPGAIHTCPPLHIVVIRPEYYRKKFEVGPFWLVQQHQYEFTNKLTENRPKQYYTSSAADETIIAVGIDVHKKTICLCVYNAFTRGMLDERKLVHDLPKVPHGHPSM